MNILKKAKILGEAGQYDSCGPRACQIKVHSGLGGIYQAKAENQNCKLFKTLMSNNCKFDCKYCQNSTHCQKKKVSYQPKELAKLFQHLRKKLGLHGLFLSSAISSHPDKVVSQMLKATELIRKEFQGYIHFKILPGTSYHLIKQASELATRMSINLEAPNSSSLSELSSCKNYKTDILRRQAWISKLKPNQTTQLIVNQHSTDKDILKMTNWEYQHFHLKRVYFSAFQPIKDTPLENEPACSLQRQDHLYNVDFLLRDYHFKLKDINSIMDSGMLPNEDPKLALAKQEFTQPVEINDLPYQDLIKIPGIGPQTAQKITQTKVTSLQQLHQLGAQTKRAESFIKINGERQTTLA